MSDLMAAFGTLQDEYYPGSKQKRRESRQTRRERLVEERRQAREEEGWDAHPKKGTVNGVDIEVFPVGALAKALGRDSVTVRAWMRKGWLPRNRYKTPAVVGSRGNASRRLWSRTQIEGIVAIAREEGLLLSHPPRIQTTNFTQRVFAAWMTWP
jgi:hypothetical protein